MKIEFPHSFSQEEATSRVRALTDYWFKKYNVRADWQETRARIQGKVKGISFDGTFIVESNRLSGEVKVGFLAEKLGGKNYVEHKLAEYLDPQNSLESLQART